MKINNIERLQQRAKRLARIQEKQCRRCVAVVALDIYGPTNCPDCHSPLTEREGELNCNGCGKTVYADCLESEA